MIIEKQKNQKKASPRFIKSATALKKNLQRRKTLSKNVQIKLSEPEKENKC